MSVYLSCRGYTFIKQLDFKSNGLACVIQVNLLLKEYVLSGDTLEAERCLKELEVPHFHHEFVYEVNITRLLENITGIKSVGVIFWKNLPYYYP